MLSFVKFETKYIGSCLNFIQQNLLKHQANGLEGKTVKVTGGGAYKYKDLITSKLGCQYVSSLLLNLRQLCTATSCDPNFMHTTPSMPYTYYNNHQVLSS